MKRINLFLACMFSVVCWSNTSPIEIEGFVAGTLVKTPEGYSAIESLSVGDFVMSCDFEGGCVERRVLAIHQKQASRYLEINVAGEKIGVGYSHMLFSAEKNFWTNATSIEASSILLNAQNQNMTVSGTHPVLETVTLYSLSVEQFQNYFVSKADILVHNYTMAELDMMLDRLSPREQAQVLIMETAEEYGGKPSGDIKFLKWMAWHEDL